MLLGIGHCDGADDIDYLVKKAPRSIVIEGVTSTGRQGYFAFGKDE